MMPMQLAVLWFALWAGCWEAAAEDVWGRP